MTEGVAGRRIRVLGMLVVFMFLALTVRLWFLQVMASERFAAAAEDNRLQLVDIPAPRGRILDANGIPIVDNQPSLQVMVDRNEVQGHEEEVIFALSKLLKLPAPLLAQRLESPKYLPYAPVPVAFNVEKEIAFAVGERPWKYRGVEVVEVPSRQYAHGDLLAHLLGSIGPIFAEDADDPKYADYDPNDYVGRSGLEEWYEPYLRGTKGTTKLRINAAGKILGEVGEEDPPLEGDDVRLHVDIAAQELTEDSLDLGMEKARDHGFKATSGAVVVMDPTTGGIVAMVSRPAFDPSIFNGGLSEDEMALLGMGEARDYRGPLRKAWKDAQDYPPLNNLAIAGEYPPGSTIKPFMALSALREGFMDTNDRRDCNPYFEVEKDIEGQRWNNWSTQDYGYITLSEALVISCDTVFYDLGYNDYWSAYYPPPDPETQPNREPKELMQRDLESFGFGKTPLVDAVGAQSGVVPDTEWKYETFYKPRYEAENVTPGKYYCAYNFCPGDFINMSIGQGNMTATPLQLAVGMSTIATNGRMCQPQLGMQAQRPDGRVIEEFAPLCHQIGGYAPSWYRYVRQALTGVVGSRGTAHSAFIGFPTNQLEYFGGKTGTAQMPNNKQDASWFAGIAKGTTKQGDDKTYVIVAVVEQGGHGSETAAPIVRRITAGLFGLQDGTGIKIGAASD